MRDRTRQAAERRGAGGVEPGLLLCRRAEPRGEPVAGRRRLDGGSDGRLLSPPGAGRCQGEGAAAGEAGDGRGTERLAGPSVLLGPVRPGGRSAVAAVSVTLRGYRRL